MHNFLPFIVIGLTTGSVYGLAAVGLVLTFRTSRIFNFAHGALATVAVLLFLALVYRAGLAWQVAAAIVILVIGPLMGGGFELLGRRLSPLSTEAKVAATIGLVLLIEGAVTLWGQDVYSARASHVHPSLPGSVVRILGVNVGADQIIIVATGLLATALLYVVIERTTLGMSMRAVVDNRELLSSTGRRPTTALRAGWALGIGFVALSGLLLVISPSYSVSPTSLGALVLQAFGGAAIGGFSSLPLAYLGGVVIGVASAVSTKYVADVAWLSGLPPSIPFVVLFVVLILQPRKLAAESTVRAIPPSRRTVELPSVGKVALALALVGAVAAVPCLATGFSSTLATRPSATPSSSWVSACWYARQGRCRSVRLGWPPSEQRPSWGWREASTSLGSELFCWVVRWPRPWAWSWRSPLSEWPASTLLWPRTASGSSWSC